MNGKPSLVYVLIILWILVGILFAGTLIKRTTDHLDYLEQTEGYSSYFDDSFNTLQNFSFYLYALLFIAIIIISCLLVYGMLLDKKWSWLISIMLTSFLGMFLFMGIYMIGAASIMENFSEYFENFEFITYLLMIFIVPILLFILMRPEVKSHFGKN